MTDYFTIKLPEDDGERHNERRKDLGLTWAEYIDGAAPQHDLPGADEVAAATVAAMDAEGLGNGASIDAEALVNDLVAQLPPRIAEELQT